MSESIPCIICNSPFSPRAVKHIYCSWPCQKEAARRQSPPTIGTGHGLNTGSIGALSELVVSIDLLRRGFHVYRSMSQHAPCDLVAFRNGETPLKIEVKTGQRLKNGRISSPPCGPRHEFDALAVVMHDQTIVYTPALS